MSSNLGHFFVWGALAAAALGAIVGLAGGLGRRESLYVWPKRMAWTFFVCMAAANLTMVSALLRHDFSVKYVAQVGSLATPTVFTVVSLWSALEGSILFWGVILGTYLLAFTLIQRDANPRSMALGLGTMLAVGVFFAFLIAGPADPFIHLSPAPTDGPGPNPLLQNHILMVIHPPMLYLGYVGMVVPFGLAVSALLRGELGEAWLVPLRRWTLIPWTFLSVGIILGSWWAYAVLGWGGYWAWDPVENASFLPWLTGTAFLHSVMVVERKRSLKMWTVCLSLATFILTIIGTFMTRSGIFNSVHSFTQSDIGPTFLAFIAVLFAVSVGLLAVRGPLLLRDGEGPDPALSRETSILVNNLAFSALAFTVFCGTTFPLVNEAIRGTRISVGEPYFNIMAVPGGMLVLFLMGVGPSLPWGAADRSTLQRQFLIPTAVGLAAAAGAWAWGVRGAYALVTFAMAGFAGFVTARELTLPLRKHGQAAQEPWLKAVWRAGTKSRRRVGGYVIHAAMVVIFVAIASSRSMVTHTSGTLAQGNTLSLGQYQLRYDGADSGKEPHRTWTGARLSVTQPNGQVAPLRPRMNFYEGSTDPIGTPAILTGALGDFYVSLMAFADEGRTASFNVWFFPMVAWIWWSIPLIVLGSVLALWPRPRSRVAVLAGASAEVPTSGRPGETKHHPPGTREAV